MNVIWHNYKSVQAIVPEDIGVVMDSFRDHVRDGRLAEAGGSIAGFVQQTVQGGKCLSGVERVGRESPVGRQTIVETPREEDRLIDLIEVRKSPPVERHTCVVGRRWGILKGRPADRGSAADQGVRPTDWRVSPVWQRWYWGSSHFVVSDGA